MTTLDEMQDTLSDLSATIKRLERELDHLRRSRDGVAVWLVAQGVDGRVVGARAGLAPSYVMQMARDRCRGAEDGQQAD